MNTKRLLLVIFVLLLLSSCASIEEMTKGAPETPEAPAEELPKIVAILPFQNETEERGLGNQVRRAFYNHFSSKPYRDVETSIVDEKTVQLEKFSGKTILELKPDEICAPIGCDGIVYGKVTGFKKVYAAVYSQMGVEAEVWMINAKTGKEVFRIKDSVTYHEGSVPTSPLGIIMTAVTTAINLRDIQQVRLVNELAYKFNEKVPSPKGVTTEDRPLIKEVLTNAKESPLGKGKIVRVGLDGEAGAVATYDIGNFRKGILMKETKPGIYMGEYLVMSGDNASDMPVIVSLKRPGGLESQWIDVSGFVTIDTTPPPQVKNIRAKGFQDRIEISWDTVKNISDLKGYAILRSEQPLSGYVELAKVELNLFEDKTVKPDTLYYYRVTASDQAGNESEFPDPSRASLISKEPVALSGEIKKDTILSGVFLIKGGLTVPKGLTLTLESDTRMIFEEDASLNIYGKIIVNGKELPVEFVSSENKKWKGINVDGGNITMTGSRIKGADIALLLKNADGLFENGVISDSNIGISINGIPSVTISGSIVSGNKTGIELQKTDAKIFQSNIFQNSEGIVIRNFSGEIKDNNIYDNEKNIISEPEVKLGANYLGTVNMDEMKVIGVVLAKAYDNKFPDGKIVGVISNPYTHLSQEERQKESTTILVEAGDYFRQRNYGKAVGMFEEALKAYPTAEIYYYLAISYQEMKEDDKALKYLKEGVEKFAKDSTLQKSL
ncbi:MAG: hypothetical protein EPN94_02615, partial [Nitrospirae bacterium]